MCSSCEWAELLEEIEELQSEEKYDFAEDTMAGIYAWVEENEHSTVNQVYAVEHMRNSRGGK